MTWKPKNKVYIQTPMMDKNYTLCIEHESKAVCEMFKRYCMRNMPKELRWFLQCDGDTFKMFEYWILFDRNPKKQDLLFDFAEKVAENFDIEFDIC